MSAPVTDELHELIHSLSAQEKRYLQLFIQRHSTDAERPGLQLLEALYAMEEYSEKVLLKQLSAEVSAKQLVPLKAYLSKTVLRALRQFHEGRTISIIIREYLTNAELLQEKRLYKQALTELDKALKAAVKHDCFPEQIQILQILCELHIARQNRNLETELLELQHQMQEAVLRMAAFRNLRDVHDQAFVLFRTAVPNKQNRAEELNRKLNALSPDKFSVFLYQYHFLNAQAILLCVASEWVKAHEIYMQIAALWEAHPERIRGNTVRYKIILSNLLSITHAVGKFELMPELIARIRKHPCQNADEEAEQFQNTAYMELLHLMNTDGYDHLDELVKDIEAGLQRYKSKIIKARELAFFHNIGMSYLLMGRWSDSQKWLDKIIAQEKTEHRQDLQHAARLLRLLLWYELGKHDLLEYELVNTERYLRTRKAWSAWESAVVKFFGKLLDADRKEVRKYAAAFLERFPQLSQGQNSADLPGISEIETWLKSIVTGNPMRELIK